ncbi:MAG: hypothetical protein WDN25_22825 [Acetobacteraceae bacterium]
MDQNETSDRSSARTLAIIAILVAVTAPFWEGPLLASINIHMPMTREIAENTSALDRLDRRTAELEQQLGTATAQLGRLQAQLAETTGRANAAAERTTTLAMVELITALRRAGAFDIQLTALRSTLPDAGELKPLLDQIEPYAVTGIPPAGRLRQEFLRISARLSDRGFMPIAWMSRILPWQRSANAAPASAAETTAQTLADAVTQVGGDDLAGAVITVQSMTGAAHDALADWVEDAKARVAADAVVQRLNDQINQRSNKTVPAARKA